MEATVISITESTVNINITPDQPIVKILSGYAVAFGGIINPMTTYGDMIYTDATPGPARLPGNTTSVKNFLVQTGTGSISGIPSWAPLVSVDIPDLSLIYQPVLPSQSGNALKFLTTNGTTPSWASNLTWNGSTGKLIVGAGNTVAGNNQLNLGFTTSMTSSATESFTSAELSTIRGGNSLSAGRHITVGDGTGFSGKNTFTFGVTNLNYGLNSYAGGNGAQVANSGTTNQTGGFAHAFFGGSSNGEKDPAVPYLTAIDGAFNVSRNTTSQTNGNGALGQDSAILGGYDHHIPITSPRSAIFGGNTIVARASDPEQVYLPNLNIMTTPTNDDTLTQILGRESGTGKIKYRNITSFTTDISGKVDKTTTIYTPSASGLSGGGDLSTNLILEVQVDNSTIEIPLLTNNLQVKDLGITTAKLSSSLQTLLSLIDSAWINTTVNAAGVVNQAGTASTSITGTAVVRYKLAPKVMYLSLQVIDITFAANPSAIKVPVPSAAIAILNSELGSTGYMIGSAFNTATSQNIPCIVSVDFAGNRLVFTPYGTNNFSAGSGIRLTLQVTIPN